MGRSMGGRGRVPRQVANPGLRAARLRRHWTEDDVAVALHRLAAELREPVPGVDANHVSKWERGDRTPSRYYRPRLCLVFEAMPEQIGLEPTPRLLQDIGELARHRLEGQRPPGVAHRGGPELRRTAFPDMDRERMAAALRYLWPVDRPLLDGILRAGRELVRRADIEAPDNIVPDLQGYRQALLALLSRSQPAAAAAQLQGVASEISRNIAWLGDPLRDWPDTYANYALAESLAREAGNGDQLAQVLVNKSELYFHRVALADNRETASTLVEGAAVTMTADALAGLKGWVLGVQATFAAVDGDETRALRYLEYAYRLAAAAPAEMNLFSDYDSRWLDGYRASALAKLRPDEAIELYESALRETDARLTWERTSVLAQLAVLYAGRGEVERACVLLGDTVMLAQATGDERGLALAERVRRRLPGRSSTDPYVRRLDEAIRTARTG
jgi:transcriptional regulator with XRE-family HTH domain